MKINNTRLRDLVHVSDAYISQMLKNSPYNYSELIALHYIRRKEYVGQEMLVKKLFIDKSLVTKMLKRFEKEKLIKRKADPLDQRYKIIIPTDKLANLVLESDGHEDLFYKFLLSDLNPNEIEVYYNFTARLFHKARREKNENFKNLEKYANSLKVEKQEKE